MVEELFQERAVSIEPSGRHFSLLLAPDGALLAIDEGGATSVSQDADDRVLWQAIDGGYRHVATGRVLTAEPHDDGCRLADEGRTLNTTGQPTGEPALFVVAHGPEQPPSDYLREFKAQGWVCLTSILARETVLELQRVAGTDAFRHLEPDRETPQFSQSAALARTAAEPVSLWLIRQYLGTADIRFAHTPALIVLTKDDGQRNVQGWHSDYPYHWGIPVAGRVPELPGDVILGVQRNVCVSEFTKVRGATAFKLGSHASNHGPPREWGTAASHAKPGYRAAHGLPYSGPDADVVEAPAGSIILYDSRTWHRAGVNRTDDKRAAMLQAMTPMYIMPKNDTSHAYKHFIGSAVYHELNDRERAEIRRLMVHRFLGPGGRYAIAGDRELTALLDA